ncbi:integral membrane protein S linking to the trans Golgi network-domain-containing protein, partial [Mycotypha africana]|uniref:integral membrane protein S linking to the trans Golgi network-domain-containing protein n=1 Tax=Mycotypha africana TaxID=64632 RepID=UPI0023010636
SSFRATKWDPIYILSQIFALQSLSYILFSLLLSIALLLLGTADTSLDLIFDDAEIRTDTGFGWSLIILWIVHAFITILLLTFIVQRARQILDFVLTFHFLHFCLCCYLNSRWPSSIAWWLLQGVDIIIMTFGGEWACMKNEMKPILITGGTKRPTSHKMSDTTTLSTEPDIELGDMAASSSHSQ